MALNADLKGRLFNWKFKQALKHLNLEVTTEERELVEALAVIFDDCGWCDGAMATIVQSALNSLEQGSSQHGKEAERLRQGIEALIMAGPSDHEAQGLLDELRELLDKVDASDSVAYLEAKHKLLWPKLRGEIDQLKDALRYCRSEAQANPKKVSAWAPAVIDRVNAALGEGPYSVPVKPKTKTKRKKKS